MNNLNNISPDNMRLAVIDKELRGLRAVFEYLVGGEQEAFNAIYFIKTNYKEWDKILLWLKQNRLTGKKLVQFFQNESPDGGGYHMGVSLILNRIDGKQNFEDIIKIDRLS